MAYKYEYNQSQNPFFHKFSILFYFISFPNIKIFDWMTVIISIVLSSELAG